MVAQSNISYKTIQKNKTLFECIGPDCEEASGEEE